MSSTSTVGTEMSVPTNYDLAKVIKDLLTIAKVAMPSQLQAVDLRIRAAEVMLTTLGASQNHPPTMHRGSVAVPYIGEADPDDPLSRQLANLLESVPKRDAAVEAGLALVMSEPNGPSTYSGAIDHILRDWLVAHGYIAHREEDDPFH